MFKRVSRKTFSVFEESEKMICPKCGSSNFRFIQQRKKEVSGQGHRWTERTTQEKKCSKCGHKSDEQ